MKRIFDILLVFAFLFTTLCSCNQTIELNNEGDEEIDIPIPAEGYIFFSSGMSKTRGAEVQPGPLAANFSILGYRYPASWGAIKSQAKQNLRISYTDNNGNVISEQTQNADNHVGVFGISHASNTNYATATPGAQEVTYSNGVHSYSPLQNWQKNLKYAFFAWYPASLVANGGNSNYEGSPYISYSIPTGVDRTARQNMLDVLTACQIDYTKRDGMTVPLKMNHRLAALDVKVNNLISAKALKETYNSVFGTVGDGAPVTIDVTAFSLTLNGIHTTAKIPLNDKDANEKIVPSNPVNRTYTGFAGASSIAQNSPKSIVGSDEMLILIPQDTPITVGLSMSYTVTCGGITKAFTVQSTNPNGTGYQALDIKIEELDEGYFHYLTLSLTKSGLFVHADKAVSWEPAGDDVEHTFE